jgi:hypothetical protein
VTQCSIVSSSINSGDKTLQFYDGTSRTYPADTVATVWVLVADTVEVGDVILIDVAVVSDSSPQRKDTRTIELRVVDRYSMQTA